MPPNKRRTSARDVEHHGRVTLHRDGIPTASSFEPTPSAMKRRTTPRDTPAPSSRYTPPIKSFRFRPGWHKAVGTALLLLGISVAVLNDIVLLGGPRTLLPGGHNELYLLLGIVVGGFGTWWFGWFDDEK